MARQRGKGRSSSSFARNWGKASENRGEALGDAVPLEPGNYEMQLCRATIDDYDSGRKVMLKFVVLSPDDCVGAICTYWEGIDSDERLVWLQRLMISLGIDLDSVTIESEDDLLAAFQEVIDEGCACRVRVTEKDGYTNMRVLKAIESDDLLDPEEALKGTASSRKRKAEEDVEEGEEDEEGEEVEAVDKSDLSVGDWVELEDGDAEITSLPPRGTKVQVRMEAAGDDDVKLIDVSEIVNVYESEGEEEEEEEEEEDEGEEPEADESEEEDDENEDEEVEIEIGDMVIFRQGRKKVEAEVLEIDGDEAKVKPEKGKAVTVALEELELIFDED